MACETCESGHWERAWFTGAPIFVHADGRREHYYECDCEDDDEQPSPWSAEGRKREADDYMARRISLPNQS